MIFWAKPIDGTEWIELPPSGGTILSGVYNIAVQSPQPHFTIVSHLRQFRPEGDPSKEVLWETQHTSQTNNEGIGWVAQEIELGEGWWQIGCSDADLVAELFGENPQNAVTFQVIAVTQAGPTPDRSALLGDFTEAEAEQTADIQPAAERSGNLGSLDTTATPTEIFVKDSEWGADFEEGVRMISAPSQPRGDFSLVQSQFTALPGEVVTLTGHTQRSGQLSITAFTENSILVREVQRVQLLAGAQTSAFSFRLSLPSTWTGHPLTGIAELFPDDGREPLTFDFTIAIAAETAPPGSETDSSGSLNQAKLQPTDSDKAQDTTVPDPIFQSPNNPIPSIDSVENKDSSADPQPENAPLSEVEAAIAESQPYEPQLEPVRSLEKELPPEVQQYLELQKDLETATTRSELASHIQLPNWTQTPSEPQQQQEQAADLISPDSSNLDSSTSIDSQPTEEELLFPAIAFASPRSPDRTLNRLVELAREAAIVAERTQQTHKQHLYQQEEIPEILNEVIGQAVAYASPATPNQVASPQQTPGQSPMLASIRETIALAGAPRSLEQQPMQLGRKRLDNAIAKSIADAATIEQPVNQESRESSNLESSDLDSAVPKSATQESLTQEPKDRETSLDNTSGLELSIPASLRSGDLVTVVLRLTHPELPACIKLWVNDIETDSVVDGPRWILDFTEDQGVLTGVTHLTVPSRVQFLQFNASAYHKLPSLGEQNSEGEEPVAAVTLERRVSPR